MDAFEYLVALVSVVAALGVARALSGIVRIVHARKSVRTSWIHLVWTINLLLWLVSYWWFTFIMATVSTWTPQLLIFILIYGALIFFLIALLHPEVLADDHSPFDQLILDRRWFFGSLMGLGILDLFDAWIKAEITSSGWPDPYVYVPFISFWILISGVAIFVVNRHFHAVFAVIFFASLIVFHSTILDGIPSGG
jgi:hypothetical protein